MRPLPAATVLLLTAGFLAACDSADPIADSHPLVGTWVETGSEQAMLATSDRQQQIVDDSQPASGSLDITGDAAGTLRYADVYTNSDGREGVTVFSIDPYQHPFPASYAFVSLSADATWLTVWEDGTYKQYGLEHYGGPAAYMLHDGQLTVATVPLPTGDGTTATVSGALGLPMRTLEAGVEMEVERHHHAAEAGDVLLRFVFEPDGGFRAEYEGDPDASPAAGSWEALDGQRVRLTYTAEGEPVVVDYDYRVTGGELYLALTRDVCADISNPECLRNYEREFGMAPNTLMRVRQENGTVFAPAP
jgi:hypothetical protein